jgi:FkbM family methyltransferase
MDTFDDEFSKILGENESVLEQNESDKKLLDSGCSIVIFGAGVVGHLLATILCNNRGGTNGILFCDNYKQGIDTFFQIPIISVDELNKKHRDAFVVIAVNGQHDDAIYSQLLGMGFPVSQIIHRDVIEGKRLSLRDIEKHLDGFRYTFTLFDDDISKKIVLDKVKRYTMPFKMEHLPLCESYFPDFIHLSSEEVFVDGGSYVGDTAEDFIRRTKGIYNHIHCFEPDESNLDMLRRNLSAFKNISINSKGLWSENKVLTFSSFGTAASRISGFGEANIPVISLDTYFKLEDSLPTFIKLDIEGSEKEALVGAKEIIQRVRPKLAICVYHKIEDIYVLPELLLKYIPSYHFTLRHYSPDNDGTVLYAI